MWYEGNYRRIFLDMHIDDWNEVFMSRVNPKKIVSVMKNAGVQQIVVKSRSHTGLAYFPTKNGRMHRGLKGLDYVGEMIQECHKNGLAAETYYSLIHDNWAYDHHPDWRIIDADGRTSRETKRRARYGLVCPNNEEYREYVKSCLTEMTENYDFEAIFLDMPFFPEVCYCPSCRKKYFEQTGCEMPRTIDWSSDEFKRWQEIREEWMSEFTSFAASCVKAIKPNVSIECNLSMLSCPWENAVTDLLTEACDYAGGDLYGGFLQQSYMCKYYRNVSKVLPFVYISSRCDPGLGYHTTTKTEEELLLHGIIALVHNGAFSMCDGANPDGTFAEEIYESTVKQVFSETSRYEKYVSGNMLTTAAVWFPSHSKCSWEENGQPVPTGDFRQDFIERHIKIGKLLREEHIPFDVVPSSLLSSLKSDVLLISDAAVIRGEEMDAIESYVKNGGNLYISGHIGNPRMLKMLEMESLGRTEHDVTYMNPSDAGKEFFEGFSKSSPMNVQGKMEKAKLSGEYEVLATMTLPYVMTGTGQFASIHSNPPGINTDFPAAVRKKVGKGTVIWTAAPIEESAPYMSRRTVGKMLRSLITEPAFTADAPAFVEILGWEKEGKKYYAAVNEQDGSPIAPISDIAITLPYEICRAELVEEGIPLKVEVQNGKSVIYLPKLNVFHVFTVE